MKKQAFTLVELIVVITILAVLGTIAFVSFQSYTLYARDSVRLSNLRNIESGLQIQYTKGGYYAVPDDFVSITASGTLIRQQGVFGPNSLRTIQANTDASKDPLTEQYYDYVTDAYQSEYQLIGYMESDEAMTVGTAGLLSLQGTHASGTGFTMKTLGQDMGIVSTGGVDLHRTEANIRQSFDIRNNGGVEYKIVFDETDEIISSSGSELFSNVYNRSRNLLKNKELAKLDDSLVLYFDMETTTMSGGIEVLKDFSQHENNGEVNGLIDIGTEQAIFGKGTYFNGEYGNFIKFGTTNLPVLDTERSIFVLGKTLSDCTGSYCSLLFWGSNYYLKTFELAIASGNLKLAVYGPDITLRDVQKERFDTLGFIYKGNKKGFFLDEGKFIEKDLLFNLQTENLNYGGIGGGRHGYLHGVIDEVRIYNRALSEKEIKTVYGSTLK